MSSDLNVAHKEADLTNPSTNKKTPGFTNEERTDFSRILAGPPTLIDTWRHLHPDERDYTYFSYRFNCRSKYLGWRLDYFVVLEKTLPLVKDCVIRNEAYGASDHVPLVLIISKTLLKPYLVIGCLFTFLFQFFPFLC
jgi:AP endonuclease 1